MFFSRFHKLGTDGGRQPNNFLSLYIFQISFFTATWQCGFGGNLCSVRYQNHLVCLENHQICDDIEHCVKLIGKRFEPIDEEKNCCKI